MIGYLEEGTRASIRYNWPLAPRQLLQHYSQSRTKVASRYDTRSNIPVSRKARTSVSFERYGSRYEDYCLEYLVTMYNQASPASPFSSEN